MKKFKRLLSLLLCFALVFSIFPGVSYAGLADGATGKAKIEMVLLKEDSGSADGSGFTPLTDAEIAQLGEGDNLFVGFKMVDFDNIAEMVDGLGSCVFRVDYRQDYLKCEPDIADEMDSLFSTMLNGQLNTRMTNSDLWKEDTYTGKIQMTTSSARKQTSDRGGDWLTTTYATAYSLLDAGFYSGYKGETDEYLLVSKFSLLQDPPANAMEALAFAELGDSSNANEGFTMKLRTASYQNNGTDNTESNNICSIMDYDDTAAQDLFPEKYTVTYNANKPTDAPADVEVQGMPTENPTVNKGLSLAQAGKDLPATDPTLAGYVFDGWFDSQTGGNAFTKDTAINADTDVYAQWTKGYSVTFDANGGTLNDGNETKVVENAANVDFDATATPTATRTTANGTYTFAGWNTKADGSGTNYTDGTAVAAAVNAVDPKESATFYAQWTADPNQSVTVNFHGNGVTANPASAQVYLGDSLGNALPALTREGYTLARWNTAQNGTGTDVAAGTAIDASLKDDGLANGQTLDIYAQWEVTNDSEKAVVTFDNNNGTTDSDPTTITVKKGDSIGEEGQMPNAPTKIGNAFVGWATTDNAATPDFDNTTRVDGNITVYAVWKEDYQVKFDPGKGTFVSGETGVQTASVSAADPKITAQMLADNAVTAPDKYKFKEWNTKADGSGDAVAADYTLTVSPTTLYAIYEPGDNQDTVTVTFDANGGEPTTPKVVSIVKGDAFSDAMNLPEATRAQHTFDGWFTSTVGGTPFDVNAAINEPTTVYAHWTPDSTVAESDKVTLTFYDNINKTSQQEIGKVTAIKGQALGLTADPVVSRDGFNLVKWNDAAGNPVDLATFAPSGDTNIYAIWSKELVANVKDTTVKYNGDVQGITIDTLVDKNDTTNTDLKNDFNVSFVYALQSDQDTPVDPKNVGEYVIVPQVEGEDATNADIINVDVKDASGGEPDFIIEPFDLTAKLVEKAGNTQVQKTDGTSEAANLEFEIANKDQLPTGELPKLQTVYYTCALDTNGYLTGDPAVAATAPVTHGKYAAQASVAAPSGSDSYLATNYTVKDYSGVEMYNVSADTSSAYVKLSLVPNVSLDTITITQKGTDPGDTDAPVQLYDDKAMADTNEADFDPAGTTKPYYAQVEPEKQITITLGGTLPKEDGPTISLKDKDNNELLDPEGTTPNITWNDDGSVTIGPLSLPEPDGTSTNDGFDNKLVITVGDKEYEIDFGQLVDPKIVLTPGNSPYGMIMNDDTTWKSLDAYKNDTQIDEETGMPVGRKNWIADAKDAYNAGNKFVDGDYKPVGADTKVTYWPHAWVGDSVVGKDADIANPEINMDRNDTAQFLFNRTDFVDAGYELYDATGAKISNADVNVTVTVDKMTAAVDSMMSMKDTDVLATTVNISGGEKIFTDATSGKSYSVRPGVYKITYTYTDSKGRAAAPVTRNLVVVWENGDVDMTRQFNDTDAIESRNIFSGRKNPKTGVSDLNFYLYRYRIADVDNTHSFNDTDAIESRNYFSGRKTKVTYYTNIK